MKKIISLIYMILIIFITACSNNKKTTQFTNQTTVNQIAVIRLSQTITIEGDGVNQEENKIKIFQGGTYHFSGELTDGYIEVNTIDKVTIVLNDVIITNPNGPALLITNAKETIIELRGINTLIDGDSDSLNDGTIFSNDTLIIQGDGTLNITGNNNEGISSDDDIIINGGTIRITSVDDGLNANDHITINNGYLFINADGDGIDSNGSIVINGGTVISLGTVKNGNGGIDATLSYTITGGTVIATGINITSPSIDSTQPSIYYNFEEKLKAGTLIYIEDEQSNKLLTFAPAKKYQVFYYSTPILTNGNSYLINIGGTMDGNETDGIYDKGLHIKGNINYTTTAKIKPTDMLEPDGH